MRANTFNHGRAPWFAKGVQALGAAALAVAVLLTPGCGGCQKEPKSAQQRAEEEKAKKEKELAEKKKKKPDFEIEEVRLRPGSGEVELSEGSTEQRTLAIKPGHWVNVYQPMKANNFDFVGELEATVVGKQGGPIDLDRTPFRLTATRPVALPKGQQKYFDVTFFVPHTTRNTLVSSVLRGSSSSQEIKDGGRPFFAMPPYQYYFVVLARNGQRYAYMKVLDSVRSPWEDERGNATTYYQVVRPELQAPLALPSYPLAWTGTAFLLWDDVDPDLLSAQQQQSLVDWLHSGGQLLISGPNSLNGLRGSFLDDYLPATSGEAEALDDDDLRELSQFWTPTIRGAQAPQLSTANPWAGLALEKHAAAQPVEHTAGLVLERPVGRGRVVLTAFRLDQRDLVNWRGFDSFFNGCLLRRPARRFSEGPFGGLSVTWAQSEQKRLDSRLVSGVEYFSRDTGVSRAADIGIKEVLDEDGMLVEIRDDLPEITEVGGVAGWNSLSPCSNAARDVLRTAAGIVVPKASFVVWVLAGYLAVLVPLNWLLFRLLGRVEWAWIAAPLIAIACSIAVVRLAQLDIGFARSQTEVAVLEIQGDYERAHLTRYTALYTSLSTNYDIQFADPSAVAQPFPADAQFKLLPGQSRSTVTFRRDEFTTLADLGISSNTTGMVHSEQMFSLGGPLRQVVGQNGIAQVQNDTTFDLHQVGVLRRRNAAGDARLGAGSNAGILEACWIGDLPAGATAPLEFKQIEAEKRPFAEERVQQVGDGDNRLNLDLLYELAEDATHIEPGETRLVGRIDGLLSGETVIPEASQVRAATLVIAHLTPRRYPPPQRDVNSRFDFASSPIHRPPSVANQD